MLIVTTRRDKRRKRLTAIDTELAQLRAREGRLAAVAASRNRARDAGRKVILGRILIARSESGEEAAYQLCCKILDGVTRLHDVDAFREWSLGFGGPSEAPVEPDEDRARRRWVHRQIVVGGGLIALAFRADGEAASEQVRSIVESLQHAPDVALFAGWFQSTPPRGGDNVPSLP